MASRKDLNSEAGLARDASTSSQAAEDEEDVEGHSLPISPLLGRDIAKARNAEIERSVRAKQHEHEAKRIFRR